MTTETYGPAAYRGQALPALPPPIRDRQGLFDTALRWGHYANLDAISDIEGQLKRNVVVQIDCPLALPG